MFQMIVVIALGLVSPKEPPCGSDSLDFGEHFEINLGVIFREYTG
jgi:hypothetical protein